MGRFEPVDLSVNFARQEETILEFWKRERIFEQLRARNQGHPRWSFIDGPMTANNPMGVHHAWGRTYKDVFQRYHAMLGFDQRYQNGFDCQGLWLEVETEKELGFNSKQDIENYGLEKFSRACRARVEKFGNIISEQSARLGQWMDWDHSYYTMTDANIEHIWHFLGICQDKGWLRRGTNVMPWCTRCGTSLSQHELADSYQDIDDTSVFLGFKLTPGVRREGPWLKPRAAKGGPPPTRLPGENERLLVWTTTPWTLTSNTAAAVNPDLKYARVEYQGAVYYASAGVAQQVFRGQGRVLEEIPGREMIGWLYEGPFDDLPVQQGVEHVVVPWDLVGETEGSGIVHIAPGCGAEDHDLGEEFGLAIVAPLDGAGIYLDGFGWLTGRDVHDVEEPIFEDLKRKGIFLRSEAYAHRYPFCWRCHEKLVFRTEREWFIRCDEIRPQMKEAARQVRWVPESVGKRTQDWYDNMGDWCISRKRYWGLPLPFYFCSEGHLTLARSRAHLRAMARAPDQVDSLPELHRPWIDAIQVGCQHDGCGREATRVPDVGDCWLDAGIVAFSTLHYLDDHAYWETWFPAELVSEMREQVRLWFYAMMFMSVTLEGRPPYKVVQSYEKLADEKGEAMHRSRGNAIWFEEAVEKMGADVMRWLYAACNPNQNLRFGFNIADDVRRRLITLWNVYSFLVTYAELDGFDPAREGDAARVGESRNALDRWILSALYQLVADTRAALEDFDTMVAMREADRFLERLSTWYVRRSRRRFWKSESDEDKRWAYRTLHHVMLTYVRLLAPVVPFLAEAVYRNLTAPARAAVAAGQPEALRLGWDGGPTPESVHLTPYPAERPELVDRALNEAMDFVLRVVSLGRAAREQARIKVRQPVATLWIVPLGAETPAAGMPAALRDLPEALRENLLTQIRDELNVKAVDLTETDAKRFARERVKLDFAVLGKRLGPAMKAVGEAVKAGRYAIDAEGNLRAAEALVAPEEYRILLEPEGEVAVGQDRSTLVALDTRLTDELRLEGWARELVRRIQDLRKQAGYRVEDRIKVCFEIAAPAGQGGAPGPDPREVLKRYCTYIQTETLATELTSGRSDAVDRGEEVAVEKEMKIWVGVRKA
jgi:isoleucyl-tRNA synthetase